MLKSLLPRFPWVTDLVKKTKEHADPIPFSCVPQSTAGLSLDPRLLLTAGQLAIDSLLNHVNVILLYNYVPTIGDTWMCLSHVLIIMSPTALIAWASLLCHRSHCMPPLPLFIAHTAGSFFVVFLLFLLGDRYTKPSAISYRPVTVWKITKRGNQIQAKRRKIGAVYNNIILSPFFAIRWQFKMDVKKMG